MKFFEISRIEEAIRHLENFDSNWVIVPLVLAENGVGADEETELQHGGDKSLDEFFSGSLIGLAPYENGANSLRPRFSDFYPNMRAQGKEDDFVYHQPTKLWANVYSSRGYREMRMAGLLSGEKSKFKLEPPFAAEWQKRIAVGGKFSYEEFLIWLFAFRGVPDTISCWSDLDTEFQKRYVIDGNLKDVYRTVFSPTPSYPWPVRFLSKRPSDKEFQQRLFPSSLTKPVVLEPASFAQSSNQGQEEGVDGKSYDDSAVYPLNDVLIRSETRTVFEVVRRINSGKVVLDPDFQRYFIWALDRQSKLIESALMRIPLPVFYLAERQDGTTVVVDGLQRLTTFKRFLNNEFVLSGLSDRSGLNNKGYDDLPSLLQSRIEDTNLILYLIDYKVPERAKLDIFERVNLGVPLTRQQMRNCMYVGKATRWLKRQAKSSVFLEATCGKLDPKTMRDRECINRFCAFDILKYRTFKGDLDQFLAEALGKMNLMSDMELNSLSERFQRSMNNNIRVFGRHAFRKHRGVGERLNPLNVALFDVFSVLFSDLDEAWVQNRHTELRESFFELMNSQTFEGSISSGTSDPRKVRLRFSSTEEAIAKVRELA